MAGESGQLTEFIEGLGPGQLVGRQVLGAPALGDIQLSLRNTKGYLEVEVVRARDLQPKPNSKVLPGKLCSLYSELPLCHRRYSLVASWSDHRKWPFSLENIIELSTLVHNARKLIGDQSFVGLSKYCIKYIE